MKIGLGPITPATAAITATSVTGHMRCTTPRWSVASSGVAPATAASSRFCASHVGVGIEAEDLAEVRLARRSSASAGRPWGRTCVSSCGKTLALAEPRQPQPGHEAAADERPAGDGELLVVDVDAPGRPR